MKHNLIKTENYLLVVSDEEIKVNTYCYDEYNKVVFKNNSIGTPGASKKIIAHLPLNGAPYLNSIDVLPEIVDDVEKLANEEFPIGTWDSQSVGIGLDMFKAGYNKAKETYKYTEEDLRNTYIKGYNDKEENKFFNPSQFIQSLNQPKLPIAFECEMEKDYRYNDDGEKIGLPVHETNKPKTITTLRGTEWVGMYEF